MFLQNILILITIKKMYDKNHPWIKKKLSCGHLHNEKKIKIKKEML